MAAKTKGKARGEALGSGRTPVKGSAVPTASASTMVASTVASTATVIAPAAATVTAPANAPVQLVSNSVKCTMVLTDAVLTKLDEASIAHRKRGRGALQRSEILRSLVELATIEEILEAVEALRAAAKLAV